LDATVGDAAAPEAKKEAVPRAIRRAMRSECLGDALIGTA
jgi:hypothetical protein